MILDRNDIVNWVQPGGIRKDCTLLLSENRVEPFYFVPINWDSLISKFLTYIPSSVTRYNHIVFSYFYCTSQAIIFYACDKSMVIGVKCKIRKAEFSLSDDSKFIFQINSIKTPCLFNGTQVSYLIRNINIYYVKFQYNLTGDWSI